MDANILAVWEYDNPADLALSKASWLAISQDSMLTVVGYSCTSNEKIDESTLHTLASEAIGNNTKIVDVTVIDYAQLNDYLLSANETAQYQLVVKTASKYKENVKDEADWQLIRELHQPLLLSMNRKWHRNDFRVLASLDISDTSGEQSAMNRGVLSVAKAAQQRLDAEIHAVYVIGISKTLSELAIKERDEVLHEKGDETQQALNTVLAASGLSDVHSHVLAGVPQEEITRLANKKKYDLVIMGSIGRKGLKGLLLGNTAEKTIENLREDLLVIKPNY